MRIPIYLVWFLLLSCSGHNKSHDDLRLWYNQPADASKSDHPNGWHDDPEWLKALPLGNGSLGVMVFGDVNRERIQLNEESMWSGSPHESDHPEAHVFQDQIRQLLFEGKYREATELTNRTQVCQGPGSGFGNGANVPFGCFQTLGDLWIDWRSDLDYKDYYRELDLRNAVVRVSYTRDGVRYEREIFTSCPDQVMVARFTADKPGMISFRCTLTRPEKYTTYAEKDHLVMSGALPDGKGGSNLEYMARLKGMSKKGEILLADTVLEVIGADEAILVLSASTGHRLSYPDYRGRDYRTITRENIENAGLKSYQELLNTHTRDYRDYFDRMDLRLGNHMQDTIPTDDRVKRFRSSGNDPHLVRLVFQYGRFLLISSSRPGTLPANLQGIWANKIQTPWNGDYHTDVNVEMNYWSAEVTNLSEMHLPLFDLIYSLVPPGSKTARVQYRSRGWVVHPITNAWGYTSPGESATWGMHTGAAAWICQHIGEHFRFTNDTAFLEKMYPVLLGAVEFYMDWLVIHPVTGKLVSGPAVSPENTFIAPDGSHCQISMGPSHDQQVIWQLFDDFGMISEVLKRKNQFAEEVELAKNNLQETRIGSDGRLMEWAEEYTEAEPGHRHISHLFAVHPGSQINPVQTPELTRAAEKSLACRLSHGGGHTGWSAAWLISQFARLHDAEKAKESIDMVLSESIHPNLFGNCPPFQMDNNFGLTSGIAEMLLQSHVKDQHGAYVIHVLPALPAAWDEGSVSGLKARGNVLVDIWWKNGQLEEVRLKPVAMKSFVVKYNEKELEIQPESKDYIRLTLDDFKKNK